jgi:hypothetical protein
VNSISESFNFCFLSCGCPNFGSICKCRSRHSFTSICFFSLFSTSDWICSSLFINLCCIYCNCVPQAINKTIYLLKCVITYHYFSSHSHLYFHSHCLLIFTEIEFNLQITVLARSKAFFARSNTGIVGSNPTQGIDICLCQVAALRQADPPSKESYRLFYIEKLKWNERFTDALHSKWEQLEYKKKKN